MIFSQYIFGAERKYEDKVMFELHNKNYNIIVLNKLNYIEFQFSYYTKLLYSFLLKRVFFEGVIS